MSGEATTAEPPFPVRSRIRVQDLAAKPEYNGKVGRAISWDSGKERVGVLLDSGEKLSLRVANLALVEAAVSKAEQKAKERSVFKQMFSKPGVLSVGEVPIVWQGGALPRVFFDIEVDEKPKGRVVFELWPDRTPKSAENFRALCTGERGISKSTRKPLCYRGSRFNVVMEGLAIFGGACACVHTITTSPTPCSNWMRHKQHTRRCLPVCLAVNFLAVVSFCPTSQPVIPGDTTRGDGTGGESIFGSDYEVSQPSRIPSCQSAFPRTFRSLTRRTCLAQSLMLRSSTSQG